MIQASKRVHISNASKDMHKDSQPDMSISICSLERSDAVVILLSFDTKINPHSNVCVHMITALGCAIESKIQKVSLIHVVFLFYM